MRLRRLELENFRQHAATALTFADGLTAIVGPNGVGKSTIVEAVVWCLYGSGAARGTNETLRFARAPRGSRVRAELRFEAGGRDFRVTRTPAGAEVKVEGNADPVARGIGPVGRYLTGVLGLGREEFTSTFFTGQKELRFLAQLGPAERGRFLLRVLGYDRLRTAQERLRTRRSELRHVLAGLRSALPDRAALEADLRQAETRAKALARESGEAEAASVAAAARLAHAVPGRDALRAALERERELAHTQELASAEAEAAERDLRRLSQELADIARAEEELRDLEVSVAALPALASECERLAAASRGVAIRRARQERIEALASDLTLHRERIGALEQAPALLERFQSREREQDRVVREADTEVLRLHDAWVQETQTIKTRLDLYHARYREVKRKLEQLRLVGPDGACPTCERPLRESFQRVVDGMEDERFTLTQDGKWLRQRAEQLGEKPAELSAAEDRLAAARLELEGVRAKVDHCRSGVLELARLREEAAELETRLSAARAGAGAEPEAYDAERHREAEARLAELRRLEGREAALRALVSGRGPLEQERAAAEERLALEAARRDQAAARRGELDVSRDVLEEVGEHLRSLEAAERGAEVGLAEARARAEAAEERVRVTREAAAADAERRSRVAELELELRHHEDLDAALTELRRELNGRVRPELGRLAGSFLATITDGRYTGLELDPDYELLVLEEGEERPVISGGEEDVANLALRLALAIMVAEGGARAPSVLILDEVLGSLDERRRENVIRLLRGLRDRFPQVILISHVEELGPGPDRVLRVELDDGTGASRVSDDDPFLASEPATSTAEEVVPWKS